MTKKQKSKFNPFTRILHPDEEILWLYAARLTTMRTHLKRNVLMIFGIIAVLSLCQTLLNLQGSEFVKPHFDLKIFFESFAFFTVLSLPLQIILYIAAWFDGPSLPAAYAVTNERLLTCTFDKIRSMPLEEIQDLRLRHDETITFGEPSTVWRVGEGADEALALIVDAREDRLKTLNQVQADKETGIEERLMLEYASLLQQGRG
jgi:hypothetical protein